MTLAAELLRFVLPLASGLGNPRQTAALLRELSIVAHQAHVGAIPQSIQTLGAATFDAIETLGTLDDADISASERTIRALEAAASVMDAVKVLEAVADQEVDGFEEPFNRPETWRILGRAIPGYLLRQWLRHEHPVVRALLRLADGLRATGEGGETLDFEAIGRFMGDPAGTLCALVADRPLDLWEPLRDIAAALGGLRADATSRSDDDFENLFTPRSRRLPGPGFGTSVASRRPEQDWSLDIDVEPPPGLNGVQILASPSRPLDLTSPLLGSWSLSASMGNGGIVGLVLTPDGARPADAGTEDSASLAIAGTPETPWVLIGSAGATRLELTGVSFEVDAHRLRQSPEVVASLRTEGLRLVLAAGDGDTFLANVFGGGEVSADAAFAASWSSSSGIVFGGAAGFEVTIPVDRSIGPVGFEAIRIALLAEPAGVSSELAASVTIALGPIDVVIEDVGLAMRVFAAAQSGKGAFGDLDFSVAFKPPTGLGLSLDAGVVSGGGFVSHDPDLGRYAGAAELAVLNTGIAAIGVLLTRIDGAPDAWSMFLSLSARFVGVQLGFGFTLNGVGGLVGIHRGLDEDALGDAVRTGSLDDILFPEDAVADAMRILAEIDAIFPTVLDQYVFGPVVKIGWGTPTLIEIDIGIAIQLPEPLTISLLGALGAVLPDEAAPILELNAAFAGTLNFTEGTLTIDASLSGSKVAGFLITGDLSVRMEFYGQPSFLVAFGGFHPAFDPPASFPKLERLAISLDTGDTLQLALGGYFALTSNSIQFGAFAYFHIGAAGFTAEGGTNFDALIIYRPFGFTIGLSVWVSISAGKAELLCVQLSGDLTGPNPWQLVAEASFKILGIKQSIDFELSFGDRESQAAIEEVDVQALLEEELARDDAWSVLSPAGDAPVIASSTADVPALDPAGRVQVGQRIVPLDRAIERYGNAELAGEEIFSVDVQGFTADEIEDLEDWFGSEHYFRLDQDERLSAPSFTLMKAGVVIGGSTAAAPPVRSMTYDHEVAYKDPSADTPRRSVAIAGEAMLDRALAMRSLSAPRRQYAIRAATYAVCDATTGRVAREPGLGGDFFAARTALAMTAREHGLVIPAYELELLR